MKLIRSVAFIVALLTISTLTGCKEENKEEQQEYAKSAPALPIPPAMMKEPTARANYIVDNIWKDVLAIDTLTFRDWSDREVFLSNYFGIGAVAEEENRRASVRHFFELSTPAMDSVILHMVERYYGYPGSPLFDEATYILVYEEANQLGLLDTADQIRLEDRKTLFYRNQVGQKAEDFEYTLPNGRVHTLYNSFPASELLLIFYNPGCSTCKQTLDFIAKNKVIQDEIARGLKVLCIYTDGDNEAFRDGLSLIPNFATAGINSTGSIMAESLYDLRAIPSMYLLDSERKVILKDTYPDDLVSYFLERSKTE